MIVIGLGHRARHGKGTAADAILRHCNCILKPVLHMGWADALYAEVNQALKPNAHGKNIWDYRQVGNNLVDSHFKPYAELPDWVEATPSAPVESRAPYGKHAKLLQWWGTEYRRAQDPLYWIKKGIETINVFGRKNPTGIVLVSDTRFINEFEAIKSLGGVSLKVRRLNEDGTEFRDPSRDANHISETEAENYNFDYHIDSKSGFLTEELAITTFEYIRALKAGH